MKQFHFHTSRTDRQEGGREVKVSLRRLWSRKMSHNTLFFFLISNLFVKNILVSFTDSIHLRESVYCRQDKRGITSRISLRQPKNLFSNFYPGSDIKRTKQIIIFIQRPSNSLRFLMRKEDCWFSPKMNHSITQLAPNFKVKISALLSSSSISIWMMKFPLKIHPSSSFRTTIGTMKMRLENRCKEWSELHDKTEMGPIATK